MGPRLARKAARLLYRAAGIEAELAPFPFHEAHHARAAVYIHVPKTGGNTVTRLMFGLPSAALGGHNPAILFRDASPVLFQRYFVFATVRDPYERLQSAFAYLKAGGMSARDAAWARRHLSRFGSFADFVVALEDRRVRTRILTWIHFLPQSHFLCDDDGTLMTDYLIRMEEFDSGMKQVCDRLNVSHSSLHENAHPRPGPDDADQDARLREVCADIYAQDYKVLNYAQGKVR